MTTAVETVFCFLEAGRASDRRERDFYSMAFMFDVHVAATLPTGLRVRYFSRCYDKMPDKSNLRKEERL